MAGACLVRFELKEVLAVVLRFLVCLELSSPFLKEVMVCLSCECAESRLFSNSGFFECCPTKLICEDCSTMTDLL